MIDGKPKANPRFYHTNTGVNTISRIGIVMGILQLGLTIHNLYQAYQGGYFLHQLKIETAKFMGAMIGSYIGAGVAMILGITNPVFILVAISAFAIGGSYIGEQIVD